MKELQANNKRMLSSICHVRSLLQEEMQLDSKFTDIPKNSDATTITSMLKSAYNDSNIQVVDIMKSHLDSQLSVLGVGYTTVPKYISPFVLFSASIDTTELEFSPLSFSSKGPTLLVKDDGRKVDEFDDKMFDIMPDIDIFAEFHAPSTTIGSLPPSFGLHDCKWVDTGQVSDSFDIGQYYQIKLLHKRSVGQILVGLIGVYLNDYYILVICCYLTNWVDTGQELSEDSGYACLLIVLLSFSSDAYQLFVKIAKRSSCVAMLYDSEYTSEVEVFMECSDNLTSSCNCYNLQSKSLDTSFLYSLDGAVTSTVETYKIDQLRSLEVDYKRIIDALPQRSASAHVARRMVDALGTVNLRRHYDPLTDATSLSGQSLEKTMDYPQTKVDFECKIGNFTRPHNLELVISPPGRILEWTRCVAYLGSRTLLLPQQQHAEGILTLAGLIERLFILFVGTAESSHPIPEHKKSYVATAIEQYTLEKLTNCLLQFRYLSRHTLAAMYSTVHQRAILVYYEVQHVHAFHISVSSQLSEKAMLMKLDSLVNECHHSDGILYACYSTELEKLIGICHEKGLLQKVLMHMDDMLWLTQENNTTQQKWELYITRVGRFMLGTVLRAMDVVRITKYRLEKEGTNVKLGQGALLFLQILPPTSSKVDIIDIGSMSFVLVDDVNLVSKSLCFDIITWLLCLGRLIWPCLKIGCMAMHRQALVTFTSLTEC